LNLRRIEQEKVNQSTYVNAATPVLDKKEIVDLLRVISQLCNNVLSAAARDRHGNKHWFMCNTVPIISSTKIYLQYIE